MSCSYGPGRYDPAYEQQGHDYPIGFVRWTEQRNFQAVLHALDTGALRTEPLISHRFPIAQAGDAYELLQLKVLARHLAPIPRHCRPPAAHDRSAC